MPVDTSLQSGLRADGLAVVDDFLPPERVAALIARAQERQARGDFTAARVGAGDRLQQRAEVRGDETCWLTEPLFAEEQALLEDFERLRQDLNRENLLGLFDLELHYARYQRGRGYARHEDQLRGQTQRTVSLALYLSSDWRPADGGALRMFRGDGTHRDIEPRGGRLVYFLTQGREHAVLAPQRERLSISGWFRTRG